VRIEEKGGLEFIAERGIQNFPIPGLKVNC